MPPPWMMLDGASGPMGGHHPMPILPMMVIPTVLYFARSYSTSFVGVGAPGSGTAPQFPPQLGQEGSNGMMMPYQHPLFQAAAAGGVGPLARRPPLPVVVAGNAHKVVQRVLSFLPPGLLTWLCAKVLNLPEDVAQATVDYIKSQRPALDKGLLPALLEGVVDQQGPASSNALAVAAPQRQEYQQHQGFQQQPQEFQQQHQQQIPQVPTAYLVQETQAAVAAVEEQQWETEHQHYQDVEFHQMPSSSSASRRLGGRGSSFATDHYRQIVEERARLLAEEMLANALQVEMARSSSPHPGHSGTNTNTNTSSTSSTGRSKRRTRPSRRIAAR